MFSGLIVGHLINIALALILLLILVLADLTFIYLQENPYELQAAMEQQYRAMEHQNGTEHTVSPTNSIISNQI